MIKNIFCAILISLLSSNIYAKDDLYTITPSLGLDLYFLNGNGGFATKLGTSLLVDFTTIYSKSFDLGLGVGIDEVLLLKKGVNISYDYLGKSQEVVNVMPIYLVAKYFVDDSIYSFRLGYSHASSSLSWYQNDNGYGGASFRSGLFFGTSLSYPLSNNFYLDVGYKAYLISKDSWYVLSNGDKDSRTNYSMVNKFGVAISYKLDIIDEKKDSNNSSNNSKAVTKTQVMY
jgi:hypothetical protein